MSCELASSCLTIVDNDWTSMWSHCKHPLMTTAICLLSVNLALKHNAACSTSNAMSSGLTQWLSVGKCNEMVNADCPSLNSWMDEVMCVKVWAGIRESHLTHLHGCMWMSIGLQAGWWERVTVSASSPSDWNALRESHSCWEKGCCYCSQFDSYQLSQLGPYQ